MAGAAVFVVALLLFAPTLGHDFVWDDKSILLDNPALGDWSRLGELLTSDFFRERQENRPFDYWRPLVVLSHTIERSLFGDRPTGYHAVNLVLHAVTAVLVFFLGLRALERLAPAAAAGLLFAVHPVHVEVVAWVSGRSDLLLGLFLSLALLSDWEAGRSGSRRWQALALGGFLAALLSKESAAVFPALAAARAVLQAPARQSARSAAARALRAALPSLVLLGAFLVVRYGLLDVVPPSGADGPSHRLALFWTWWSALWLYARLLIWPTDLSIVHDVSLLADPWSWSVGGGLIVLATSLWAALLLRRTAPGAAFGVLVFLVGLAPLSSFLVPITSHGGTGFPAAERFLYAPSIGACMVLGWLLRPRGSLADARWRRRAAVLMAIPPALLVLALLGGAWLSVLRAGVWKDEVTLFARTVERSPRSAMARLNYGTALKERARREADAVDRRALLELAREHLGAAVSLAPDNYRGHYDLANLYQSLGRPEAAEAAFREALRLRPDLFQAMVNLGGLLAQTGRPAEALEWFEKAARARPGHLAVLVNRAHVLQALGRPEQAIPLYLRALEIEPGLVAARAGLDRALEAARRDRRAG